MSSDIENINCNDFKSICRMCLLNCDIKFFRDNVVSDVFYKLTDIHFEANEELPQQICVNCFEKIHEIHEFSLRCKQTHSSLMKCLNNFKNVRLNEKHKTGEETDEPVEIKEEITIEEHKIEFVPVNNYFNELNCANLKIKQEIIETTNNEANEDIIPGTSGFINVQNEDACNIKLEIEEQSNFDANSDVSDENENSSNSSNSSDINSAENEIISMENKEETYNCDDQTFVNLASFKGHESFPSSEDPFRCNECFKTFKRATRLKEHMLVHSAERPHKCVNCSKSFKHASDLRKHMHVHSAEPSYKCVKCSKSFFRASYLKNHIVRLHTNERPHTCVKCSKSFNLTSTLKQHMRLHTSERPHKCSKCSKSFKQAKNLKEHMLVHTGERPHTCVNCSKSFIRLSDLKKHMRVHSA